MESPATVELLRQIVANTKTNDSLWIAAVAGGSAVLGAAISGLFAYLAARRATTAQSAMVKAQSDLEMRKLRASLVTAERLNWLKDLRSKVAEFYANVEQQMIYVERVDRGEAPELLTERFHELSAIVRLQSHEIWAVLNSHVTEQKALADSVEQALFVINRCGDAVDSSTPLPARSELANFKVQSFDELENIGRKCWRKVQELE